MRIGSPLGRLLVAALVCGSATSLRVGVCPSRAPAPAMGLFDGLKDALGGDDKPAAAPSDRPGLFGGLKDALSAGDKPLVAEDRVTPFDRWLGLDKELVQEQAPAPKQDITFVDPTDAQARAPRAHAARAARLG